MAGGWQDLAKTLNNEFATNLSGLANDFKNKHGNDGNGGPGKTPYKFGHFAHRNPKAGLSDRANARFLVDSGTRHWADDPTKPRAESTNLQNLEDVVKFSLTNANPKKITFTVQTDANATNASAAVTAINTDKTTRDIKKGAADNLDDKIQEFTVVITCPPGLNP